MGARLGAVVFVLVSFFYLLRLFSVPGAEPVEVLEPETVVEHVVEEKEAEVIAKDLPARENKEAFAIQKADSPPTENAPAPTESSISMSNSAKATAATASATPANSGIYMAGDITGSDAVNNPQGDERFMKWDNLRLGLSRKAVVERVPECEPQFALSQGPSRGRCTIYADWGSVAHKSIFLFDDRLASMRFRVAQAQTKRFYRNVERQWGPAHRQDVPCRNRGDQQVGNVVRSLGWESARAYARICEYAPSGSEGPDQLIIRVSVGYKGGEPIISD